MTINEALLQTNMNNKKRRLSGPTLSYLLFSGIVPLILGMCFYILFCPNVVFVKALTTFTGIKIRNSIDFSDTLLWLLLRYYLLDFLWAQSFSSIVMVICLVYDLNKRNCIIACVALCVFSEVIQLFGFVNMTFDFVDILVQLCGLCIALIVFKIITRRREIK